MKLTLPGYVTALGRRLCDAGYEAYVVGGYVRDCIRGVPAHDADMTTNATPEQIKEVFFDLPVKETGIRHGTVTVLTDSQPVEITTFRTDGSYTDNRHPDSVQFAVSLPDDLSRRDFTVNAIACDILTGKLTDLYGGIDDIKKGILRCVGEPDRRLREDALRILRALRFSSVLGYTIDEATADSIERNRLLLQNLSPERVYAELKKLLVGKNVREVMKRFATVFAVILPEIEPEIGYDQQNFHHIYTLWEHTATAVASAPPDIQIRLCMLLHDCGKPHCRHIDETGVAHYYGHSQISATLSEQVFERLRADKKTANAVITLIKHHDAPLPDSEKLIKRRLRRFGQELFMKLIEVHKADTLALAPEYIDSRLAFFAEIQQLTGQILAQGQCFTLKSLAVDGRDIASLGYRGKQIGEVLDRLLCAVTDEKVPNTRERLLRYAMQPEALPEQSVPKSLPFGDTAYSTEPEGSSP